MSEQRAVTVHTPTGPRAIKAGDLVWRWVLTGSQDHYDANDVQPLKVVRVNRTTFTVDTQHHGRGRVPHNQIVDFVDWEGEDWAR